MNNADAIKANVGAHNHVWLRDDRDGYREYVCAVCAYSMGVKK